MASHTEIKVNDSNWVIRAGGVDVQVKILEKIKKASGRGWEFRVKRVGADGRVTGRNLVRGSGALRRPGQPTRTTGFSKNGPAKKAKPKAKPKAKAPPKPRRSRSPGPAPSPYGYSGPPPASAFFSGVQEPGGPRSSPPRNGRSSSATRLGSLRGRGKAPSKPSPARPGTPSPSQARREIEKQLKHANLSPLVSTMVKELIKTDDGTDHTVTRVYGHVMSGHRLSRHGVPFRGS
jgi:hypothetical protein